MNRIARAMMKVVWMAAVVGLVANAETLYDREGIQLQGTARVVTYEAGTCRVLEKHVTPRRSTRT